jgi:hypothetical protein
MRGSDPAPSDRKRATPLALALAALLAAPPTAAAHFILVSPESWRAQSGLGDPQKVGPCGDEGTAAGTGVVTAYAPGQTITVTIDETIYHPGHYRVALAVNDRTELPPTPVVTPGDSDCGSAAIQDPPVFPVLVDGALEHTNPFSGTRTIQVTLPSDVICERCTLQMLEFMSDHPAPCFYHHCADISIGTSTPGECAVDADCADDDACTTDHCDTGSGTCANTALGPNACDDGNACTLDACVPAQGCVAQPMTLGDAGSDFLGSVQAEACEGDRDRVPPVVGALFGKASAFVTRASGTPAKARRFLGRAAKRLRAAAKKAGKASGRRVSTGCGDALETILAQARARVDCLLSSIE